MLEPISGHVKHYNHFTNSQSSYKGIESLPLIEDHEGTLWLGTKDGLNSIDKNAVSFQRYYHKPGDKTSISDNMIKVIFEDSKENLWIGTEKGLNLFDRLNNRFIRYTMETHGLIDNDILSIIEDWHGNLWIGTGQGLSLYNPGLGKFLSYPYTNISGNYVELTAINSILEDQSEIIWLGTFQGLVKIDRKKKKFITINNSPESIAGLSGNVISAIYKDREERLWLGTQGTGLNVIDPQNQTVIQYFKGHSNPVFQINDNDIFSIFEDRNGIVWLGTSDGIEMLNRNNNRFTRFCETNENAPCRFFKANSVYVIKQDRAGTLWFGTSKGLVKYNPQDKTIHYIDNVFSGSQSLEINSVYCILEDHEGNIWVGTENGVFKYDQSREISRVFQQNLTDPGSLSSNYVYYLHQDVNNTIWIGTAAGLNRFDEETETFVVYTEEDGLSNNNILGILEDLNGCLWLSTSRGITRFDPKRIEFSTYDLSDGLQGYEFKRGSCFKAGDGIMYFGGISGMNCFYPDSIEINQHIPNISFTSFELIAEKGKLVKPLEKVFKIIVPQGNKIFKISFAALDFTSPEKNHYMYQMIKNESEGMWIPIGNQNHVTFYNLSPGRYTFSVKGSNNDQRWNNEGTSLNVIVPASRWQSIEAIVSYLLAGIFLVYLTVLISTRSLRRANRILKEKEAAAKEVERQREELMVKNKSITDSINYARRIQVALLPSIDIFEKILPESFILYKPKDIVSGDFYWINEHENKVFVAAIDCTGHGVPGAFMSIIGFELFRNITGIKGEADPARILDLLNDNFAEIFSDGEHVYLQDGMDLSLCVIDKKMNSLEFSGAFNPLYLVRNETIIEIKADRFSVGADVYLPNEERKFKSHKLNLHKDDILYLFSDGYADQFGGPEGKKFKYRRFRHLLLTIHKLPLDKQQAILNASIEEWKRDTDQVDDILVIGIRPKFNDDLEED